MTFWLTFQTAWRGLLANRFRTMLTMSGIIVGVGALIATLAVGRGSRDAVDERLEGMGRNAIYVNAAWRPIEGKGGRLKNYSLTLADWHAIAELHTVLRATPLLWDHEQIVYKAADCTPTLLGVGPEFLGIFHWSVLHGRSFHPNEISEGKSVALLGQGVAEKLFAHEDPLNKSIRVGRTAFVVIGVMEPKSGDGVAEDNCVLVPITTAQHKLFRYGMTIHEIVAEPKHLDQMAGVSDQIVALLCDRNHCSPSAEHKAFEAESSQQMMKNSFETSRTFSILIFLTASLSLLVGGIGIMNTMMMAVYERTREIGIRAAMGARPSDILWLFLWEALILTSVGGLIGILAGAQLSISLATWVQWPPVISLSSMVLSFGCATTVGLLSGMYPAWRASRMEPLDCLRAD